MNKYNQWYTNITERAKNRHLETYTETHHIQPRSLGGTDDPTNIIDLTAREHFICHWLLVKMTTGQDRYKMLNALRIMRAEKQGQERYHTKITARVYENIKQEYAALQSKKYSGEGNPMFGDRFYRSKEGRKSQRELVSGEKNGSKQKVAREKISIAKTGKKRAPFSTEWIKNLSEAHSGEGNGMYGKKHTKETRAKMAVKATGRKQSAETIQKKTDAIRGSKREKKLCFNCNQLVAVNGYARWHGEKCKKHKYSII